MESDSALVQRVLAGQTQAFRPLVERYRDAVFGVALTKTGRFADAEEIAQETFLAAFHRLGQLKNPASFGHWLYGIALNKTRMHLRAERSRGRAQRRLAEAARANASAEREDRQEQRAVVRDALGRLSAANREAATLYYINGYSVADISRFIRRPAGTVKRRLHDARKRLRKELLVMMEGELKRSRPGRQFTDAVIGKITHTRVRISGDPGWTNYVLLTDSQGRCYETNPLVEYEARAILSRLEKADPPKGTDIYSAFLGLLGAFGYRVLEVTLGRGPSVPDLRVRLKLRRGQEAPKTVEAEYSTHDAYQLGIHSGADFLLEKDLAEHSMIRRKDGKPMSPKGAWRRIARRRPPVRRNIDDAIRELEKNPDSEAARCAFGTPIYRNNRDDVDKLERWVQRRKGTRLEALAAGMAGATYLSTWPEPTLTKALPHLQRAHRANPKDARIAFDLATAYAQAGKARQALALLREFKFKDAGHWKNFSKLWKDRRFLEIAGKPDPRGRDLLCVKQTCTRHIMAEAPRGGVRHKYSVRSVRAGPSLRKRIQGEFEGEGLVGIEGVVHLFTKTWNREWIVLELEGKRTAAIVPPKGSDVRCADLSEVFEQVKCPWGMPSRSTLEVLKSVRIGVEAVVLRAREGGSVVGDLFARQGRRRARVPIDAIYGLSIALRAGRPILITQSLAEELAVRGKSGRPLTVSGAIRKLRSA